MLLDPPRLKPPPPRPPPPPPRPPRASTSWAMNAARLTNALSIAMREIVPRILLSHSLIGGQLDPLCIRIWNESEVRVGESWIHDPVETGDESWFRGIVAIDDHQLSGDRLVTLLNPDFPIRFGFAERKMIGRNAVDCGGSHFIG